MLKASYSQNRCLIFSQRKKNVKQFIYRTKIRHQFPSFDPWLLSTAAAPFGVSLRLGGAYLLGAQVGVLGLLFEKVSAIHRVVLLQLHRLHLLLDGLHGGGCEGVGCSE